MDEVIAQVRSKLIDAQNSHDVDQVKAFYLGKNGLITQQLKALKDMDPDQRKSEGVRLNSFKDKVLVEIKLAHDKINRDNQARKIAAMDDMSVDGRRTWYGSAHPVSMALSHLSQFMRMHGFTVVDGPEIENEYYNFDCLNVPDYHPARQDHDTFYFEGIERLLRTHTSPVQIRTLEKQVPPVRICSIGRVYRSDFDATHTPMFHQMEGLVIDRTANFANLKYMLHKMVNDFFADDVSVRFRPAYFPFTEPSAEVDIRRGDEWLEVLGCGMVHPAVLEKCGVDTDVYHGYAFGCGIDRLAMLKYGLPDLRALFENDIDLLDQFRQV